MAKIQGQKRRRNWCILASYSVSQAVLAFQPTKCGPTRSSTELQSKLEGELNKNLSRRGFIMSSAVASSIANSNFSSNLHADAAQVTETTISLESTNPFGVPLIPFSTTRQYKDMVLSNGIRVLLVSDTRPYKQIRATAALTIGDAGQFQEPNEIAGLSHLLEHMVLSSSTKEDFEEWLSDRDGASNAFTGPSSVCFHFSSPSEIFQEALGRFADLFVQENVEKICKNEAVLKREVRRVDSEIDFENDSNQAFYFLKSLVNPDHPFARFSQGSIATLEKRPFKRKIQVGNELMHLFLTRYLPSKAVLVVVCPRDFGTLEKWTARFAETLSRKIIDVENPINERVRPYPDPLPFQARASQYLIYRSSKRDSRLTEKVEKLSFHWMFDREFNTSDAPVITTSTIGFFLSQILARRGPGSLYLFLQRRGWVPRGNQGLPRISFPIDVSGFQLMRLDIVLTEEGFANRSAVIAALYDSLGAISTIGKPSGSFQLPIDLIKQYLTVARLFGYTIAPRPPDAVELAMDAQIYGVGGTKGVGVPGVWPILPSTNDDKALIEIRRAIAYKLNVISDPSKATVILTTTNRAILKSKSNLKEATIPPITSARWKTEPVSGAKFLQGDMMRVIGLFEEWLANRLDEDELQPPVPNPLIPLGLRSTRPIREIASSDGRQRIFYLDEASEQIPVWRESLTEVPYTRRDGSSSWENRVLVSLIGSSDWKLYQSTTNTPIEMKVPLPAMPPEPNCRAAFVVQLLSPRPARASVLQAALAQLWLISLDNAVEDLAELGAPAGLAYEMSFNKYGLRICFLGISQNLYAYTRRMCRRIVEHHTKLLELKPSVIVTAVMDTNRQQGLSPLRKRQTIKVLNEATAQQASTEGGIFLYSCTGAICLAQGDLLPNEAIILISDIKAIFDEVMSNDDRIQKAAVPDLKEILYKPMWKPRGSSPCAIPGVPLISDACGRVQR